MQNFIKMLIKLNSIQILIIIIVLSTFQSRHLSNVEASVEEMTTCNLNGENLVECIVKSFPLVLTEILDVDGGYKIPENILTILSRNESNFSIRFNEIILHGFKYAKIQIVRRYSKDKLIKLKVIIPIVQVNADYDIKGKVLGFPLEGKGNLKCVINWSLIDFNAKYDLIERDGKRYLTFLNVSYGNHVKSMHDSDNDAKVEGTETIENTIHETVQIIINNLMKNIAKRFV